MSKFLRVVDVLAIVILILFLVSILTLPWPVNVIIGGLILVSFILIVVSDRLAKKRKRDAEQSARLRGDAGPKTNITPRQ